MRLLAFSDLHCDLDGAALLAERASEFDVIVGAGDFASVHNGLEDTIGALRSITTPTVLVPGNNETEDALREACSGWDAATVLHGERTEVGGREFFGLGAGIPVTPWDWSFDMEDDEAGHVLAQCPDGAILVLHSPPQGHCDLSGQGAHLGSPAIADAIAEKGPAVAVCGHIHESWGAESRIGATPVYNLGPGGRELEV